MSERRSTLRKVGAGQKNVTAAGTAETLVASSTIVDSVTIKAKSANTGDIYVGGSDVDSTHGIVLDAGQAVNNMVCDDLINVYVDSSVNGEGVEYIYTYDQKTINNNTKRTTY